MGCGILIVRLIYATSHLMRRLAGLLFIDDVEAGLAAKRARTRLGGSLKLKWLSSADK